MSTNNYAKIAHDNGLSDVSTHVWEACCMVHGLGGTPRAKESYAKIMETVFDRLGIEYKDKDEVIVK